MKKILLISIIMMVNKSIFAQDWDQILKIAAINKTSKTTAARNANDYFGKSVDLDGDYAVVGAYNETEDEQGENNVAGAGSVTIYKNINNQWIPIKKLIANIPSGSGFGSVRTINDYFGYSVAISGNNVVIGAYLQDYNITSGSYLADAGAAFVFNKDAGGYDNWGLVKKIVSSDRATLDYFGFSVDIHGNTILIGAYGDDHDAAGINTLALSGSAYIFEKDNGGNNNWGQTKKIVSNDRAIQDEFGRCVSINGEIAVVGSLTADTDANGMNSLSNAGAAYVFKKDQDGLNTWGLLKKLTASNRTNNAWFGLSISVSGDYIAVGCNHLGAYIFHKNQGGAEAWGQVKNVLGTSLANTGFGFTAAIDNNKLVVGNATNKAFIFERDLGGNNNWGQQKEITISNPFTAFANTIENGVPVAIQANTVFIANDNEDINESTTNLTDNAGAIYIFNKDIGGTDNWGQSQKLLFMDFEKSPTNYFGGAVAVEGDYAVIGTRENLNLTSIGSRPSGTFLYKKINGTWSLLKKITSIDLISTDAFGYAVAISNDNIAVSAIYHDLYAPNGVSVLSNAGAVLIFSKNQGGADNWGQVKKIVASDRSSGAIFGGSIALNGNTMVVGAPFESKDANGLNPLPSAGAAYIFNKDEGGVDNWGQVKKIVPLIRASGLNGIYDVGDRFGISVAIDNNIIAIAAEFNDSDENDLNLILNTGSTYVFYKDQGGVNNWGQIKKIVANDRALGDQFGESISISGDVLAISAPFSNLDENGLNPINLAGAAYIYSKNLGGADNWGLVKKFIAFDRAEGNHFAGHDIAIKNSTLVIPSDLNDYDENGLNPINAAGSLYIYDKDNGGSNNWGLTKKIVPSDRMALDYFGVRIAFDGNTILAGAPHQDYDAYGKYISAEAGSVYFFNKCTPTSIASTESISIKEQSVLNTTYFNANCQAIAAVQSGGLYNVSGHIAAKVWVEDTQPATFSKRHYEITPLLNPTTATGKITLYYTNQDFIDYNAVNSIKLPESQLSLTENALRKANVVIEKNSGSSYDGSGKIETYIGSIENINPSDSEIIWNNTENRWEVSFEVIGFSGFFLTSKSSTPLSAKLVSFSGQKAIYGNELKWQTTNETNFSHFQVERSKEAKAFESIGKVNSIANINEVIKYAFLDETPSKSQINYYRLKMIDLGGKFEYSKIISIENKQENGFNIYPNPVLDILNIENNENKILNLNLIGAMGQQFLQKENVQDNPIKINVKGIPKGLYFIQIIDGKNIFYKNIVKH